MPYCYDVFISYPRQRYGDWVKNHFKKFLDLYLEDALGRVPDIFFDEEIETGDIWPRKLLEALGCSRCMISVWSPSYFASDWCRFECLTMLERMRELSQHRRLILPVRVSDGEGFPDYAKLLEWIDCREYFFEGRGFEDSPTYLDFQRLIRDNAADIAKAIEQAPPWRSKWQRVSQLKLPLPPSPIVPPPFLE